VLERLGHEREIRVERLGDVVGERAQERLADDACGPGRDGPEEIALAGDGVGAAGGGFENGGQGEILGRRARATRW
jgi:hypothetical protein